MASLADPLGQLDPRFSSSGTVPTTWAEVWDRLEQAEVYWFTSTHLDGCPHTTPLIAVCLDQRIFITTGPTEQKAVNLRSSADCILMTGDNRLGDGLDIVIEGTAWQVKDEELLLRLTAGFEEKYPPMFHYGYRDHALRQEDGSPVLTFEIKQRKVFAFGRGAAFSQTRFRPKWDDRRGL
jgi:Pyridoxamine 5'-phosphate oxidase